ncbi:MAG: pilus assembly protein CpaF [Planctomycetota bacterium]|jgi:pilus assembly protein CpaF
MPLLINNMLTGEKWVRDLVGTDIKIGYFNKAAEEDSSIIHLPSNLVASPHATLSSKNGQWLVRHHGTGDTLVNDSVLPKGQRQILAAGDEVRVANFTLRYVEEKQQQDEDGAKLITDEQLLLNLETSIHNKIRDEMAHGMGEDLPDPRDQGIRKELEYHISREVEAAISELESENLDRLADLALLRRLARTITSGEQGSLTKSLDKEATMDPHESILSELETRFLKRLNISLQPKKMEEEFKLLYQEFSNYESRRSLELTRGAKISLVGSLLTLELNSQIFGLGPLQDLLDSESITEIMVIAPDTIYVERFGNLENTRRKFLSDKLLDRVVERIVQPLNRRVNRGSPKVDARLPDKSRVNIVIPPLAIKGPCITIRKFSKDPLLMSDLVGFKSLTDEVSNFLVGCVEAHRNIIVSGGTGTGKTTMLNCLSSFIDERERIVTIEDTAEVQLQKPHVVTLESMPETPDGGKPVTIKDLVVNALRMRPNRIVVGECRGGETLDMLQAMNTGHSGSMTTAHANSPAALMLRLETMVMMDDAKIPVHAIREQIASAVDIVVQVNRFVLDGSNERRVTSVAEVIAVNEDSGELIIEEIYSYVPSLDKLMHTGYIPGFVEQQYLEGISEISSYFKP